MKKIFIVLSDELLADDAWHTETCRAFDNKKDANAFVNHLAKLCEDEDTKIVFYFKEVPFGKVEKHED